MDNDADFGQAKDCVVVDVDGGNAHAGMMVRFGFLALHHRLKDGPDQFLKTTVLLNTFVGIS